MARTIDKKFRHMMSHKELLKRIKKELPGNPPDVTSSRFYRSFCKDYGEAITPKLEAVESHRAGSMERAFWKVIRGGYSNN